jgi:hypothetical protein
LKIIIHDDSHDKPAGSHITTITSGLVQNIHWRRHPHECIVIAARFVEAHHPKCADV